MKTYVINAIVALLLIIGVGFIFNLNNKPQQNNLNLAGLSERDIVSTSLKVVTSASGRELNVSNLGVVRGNILSTSTPASMTLRASDIVNKATLSIRLSVGAATVTLPASTTLAAAKWLPSAGDSVNVVFLNATTTTGSAGILTIAGGTGSTLNIATSTQGGALPTTAVLPGNSNGGTAAICTVVRKVNTDFGFYCIPTAN